MSRDGSLRGAGLLILTAFHAGFLAPIAASAQEPPDSTRTDTLTYILEPLEVAVARERSAPPPVGALVIEPSTLRRSMAADPYRMLREVAPIEVHDQGQGPGYASNVVMRGFTSDHSSDVLLVVDGVPVNLPAHGHVEGYADWNVWMPASVASLRVIHGNASPLYGDFALAGAVEVFTRAEAEDTEASFSGTTFGDFHAALTTGRARPGDGLFFAAEGRRVDGWRVGSDSWVANGLARGWREAWGGRLEGGMGAYGSSWDSPGFVTVRDFNDSAFQTPVDESDGGRSSRAVVHGRFARPLSDRSHIQAVAWGLASDYAMFLHVPGHDHGGSGIVQQSGEWDRRVATGAQVEGGFTTGTGDVLFGVSGRYDDVRYEHALTLARDPVDTEIDLDARYSTGALYGRWRLSIGERLGLDLGGRVDVVRHESRPVPDTLGWQSSTKTVVSPKLGARYRLSDEWYAVATAARGFRSAVGIIGDPSRDPYLSWSYELGVERATDRWDLEVTAFRTDVVNERVFDPVTLTATSAGSSTRQGVDLRAEVSPWTRVRVSLSGTWNHARLSAPYADAHEDHPSGAFVPVTPTAEPDSIVDARRVPGLADYLGEVGVRADVTEAIEGRVAWRVVGPHVPIGEPSVTTQPYSVLDFGASWTFAEGRAIDVEVANALDIRYVELRSSGYVTPGAPRALRVQLRLFDLPSF